MKLWEVKAQALRLMFADTDLSFTEEEFTSGTLYNNPNTREKLIGMDDTIRRGIDMFYQYNGEVSRNTSCSLFFDNEEEIYKNVIDTQTIEDFGFPTRIDLMGSLEAGTWRRHNLEFMYDQVSKRIYFTEQDFTMQNPDKIQFMLFYRTKKRNLPFNPSDIDYDLNALFIPEEVQRQLPLYIKSELFEEDEPQMAQAARNKYIEFLILNQRKNFGKSRSKVKRQFPWGSE